VGDDPSFLLAAFKCVRIRTHLVLLYILASLFAQRSTGFSERSFKHLPRTLLYCGTIAITPRAQGRLVRPKNRILHRRKQSHQIRNGIERCCQGAAELVKSETTGTSGATATTGTVCRLHSWFWPPGTIAYCQKRTTCVQWTDTTQKRPGYHGRVQRFGVQS
jgi:hypothetical protein